MKIGEAELLEIKKLIEVELDRLLSEFLRYEPTSGRVFISTDPKEEYNHSKFIGILTNIILKLSRYVG